MSALEVVVLDVRPPSGPRATNAYPSSTLVGVGRMADTGQPVTFAGDPTMMWDIRHALDAGDSIVVAIIEPWQIVGGSN